MFVQFQSKISYNKMLPLQLKQRQSLVLAQLENVQNEKGQGTQRETALCECAEHLNNLSALLSTSLVAKIIIVLSYKLLERLVAASVFCKFLQSLLICSLVPI